MNNNKDSKFYILDSRLNSKVSSEIRAQSSEINSEFVIRNSELNQTLVSFVPSVEFSPHVKKVLRACWREVFLWQGDCHGAELEVYVVSDQEMRLLNKQYRQRDTITDVISLDFGKDVNGGKLGVIYLARGLIEKMSDHFGHSVEAEIVFLTIHGMLHVWGYDHEKKSDENKMLRAMKRVLENFPQYAPLLATYMPRSVIDY